MRIRGYILWLTAVLLLVLVGACSKTVPQEEKKPVGITPSLNGTPSGAFSLKVASFNVLKPEGRRGEMSMENKTVRTTLGRCITDTKAQLIAFNELDETLIPSGKYAIPNLCSGLPETWTWRLEWPNSAHAIPPATYSYANGYAYDSAVLKEEESGYVWLAKESDTWYTDQTSAHDNAGSPARTCVWVRFTHKESGRQFYFFVSHLPTESQGGGERMAQHLHRFTAKTAGSLPRVLCGDMNSAPGKNEKPYSVLKSNWLDAYETVSAAGKIGRYADYPGTQSGSSKNYYYGIATYTGGHPERRIDHIMTRGECLASSYEVITTTYNYNGKPWYPSDHLAIASVIDF